MSHEADQAREDGQGAGCPLEAAWREHHCSLQGYLRALLRDPDAAADCLQMTFARLLETGGPPKADHAGKSVQIRGWLFRVAQNCARQLQRRASAEQRGLARLALMRQLADCEQSEASEELTRRERLEQAANAIRQLSVAQQEVLRLRLHEGLRFAEIAARLQVPLGTVLTRMRLALAALRRRLDCEAD